MARSFRGDKQGKMTPRILNDIAPSLNVDTSRIINGVLVKPEMLYNVPKDNNFGTGYWEPYLWKPLAEQPNPVKDQKAISYFERLVPKRFRNRTFNEFFAEYDEKLNILFYYLNGNKAHGGCGESFYASNEIPDVWSSCYHGKPEHHDIFSRIRKNKYIKVINLDFTLAEIGSTIAHETLHEIQFKLKDNNQYCFLDDYWKPVGELALRAHNKMYTVMVEMCCSNHSMERPVILCTEIDVFNHWSKQDLEAWNQESSAWLLEYFELLQKWIIGDRKCIASLFPYVKPHLRKVINEWSKNET